MKKTVPWILTVLLTVVLAVPAYAGPAPVGEATTATACYTSAELAAQLHPDGPGKAAIGAAKPRVSPYCIKCSVCKCCSGSGCYTFSRCNGGYSCSSIPTPSCSSGSPLVYCTRVSKWCNCI